MMGKIAAGHVLGLRLSCCALLPAFLLAGPAMADAQSSGMEKASLSLSIFLADRDSSARLDASDRLKLVRSRYLQGDLHMVLFTQKWSVRASGEFFLYESGDWDGDLVFLRGRF